MKILIVDDEKSLREVLNMYITRLLNHECLEADTVDEARQLADKYKPDFILLDLLLHGENVASYIAEFKKYSKVIVMSGLQNARTYAFDADYVLDKPFNLDIIDEIISSNAT